MVIPYILQFPILDWEDEWSDIQARTGFGPSYKTGPFWYFQDEQQQTIIVSIWSFIMLMLRNFPKKLNNLHANNVVTDSIDRYLVGSLYVMHIKLDLI